MIYYQSSSNTTITSHSRIQRHRRIAMLVMLGVLALLSGATHRHVHCVAAETDSKNPLWANKVVI